MRTFLLMSLLGLLLSSAGRAQTPDFIDVPPPDPLRLTLSGAAGVLVGGLVGGGGALAIALIAEGAPGAQPTPASRNLNQLATFGTLVVPALMSVAGGVVGAGVGSGLVGAMIVGFGATVGSAVGTALALAVVPLGVVDGGSALSTTAAIGGIVIATATLGAAAAGLVTALSSAGEAVEDAAIADDRFPAAPPALAAAADMNGNATQRDADRI